MTVDIRFTGAPNFRDVGGLAVGTSHRVRPGRIFRSGVLSDLTEEDRALLAEVAPRCVIDLRSQRERELHPSRWPINLAPNVLTFNVNADMRAGPTGLERILRDQPGVAGGVAMMQAVYRSLPVACAPVLNRLFADLADEQGHERLPLIVHCTAGKDRTGFVVAMLLTALGAEHDVVLRDYLRSAECCNLDLLAPQVAAIMGDLLGAAPDRAVVDAINGVQPSYLQAAFNAIEAEWGGLPAYFEQACGLDGRRRQALCDTLLMPV